MTELKKFLDKGLQKRCARARGVAPIIQRMVRDYNKPVTKEYVEIEITRNGEKLKGWAKLE